HNLEPAVLTSKTNSSNFRSLQFPTVIVCSVWNFVGDIRPECLWLGDIELLLVAFNSQLKVFHSLKDDNTSRKHP
ncbi:hypothetical protein Tco_1363785, partial [Tanacetum coccineum]